MSVAQSTEVSFCLSPSYIIWDHGVNCVTPALLCPETCHVYQLLAGNTFSLFSRQLLDLEKPEELRKGSLAELNFTNVVRSKKCLDCGKFLPSEIWEFSCKRDPWIVEKLCSQWKTNGKHIWQRLSRSTIRIV